MKRTIIIFLVIFVAACSAEADQKLELVDQYMKVSKLDNVLVQFNVSYTTEAKRLYKNTPKSFWYSKEYKELMSSYEKSLWKGWREAYYNYLSEKELIELLSFLKTEIGAKFLKMQLEMEPIFTKVTAESVAVLNDDFSQLVELKGYR